MIRLAPTAGILAVWLSGCGIAADRDAEPVEPVPTTVSATAQPLQPTPTAAPRQSEADDACGAGKVAPWIGQESTIPVRRAVVEAAAPGSDRWIYPDSIVTQDRLDDRLNVIMEKGTNIIVSARCG